MSTTNTASKSIKKGMTETTNTLKSIFGDDVFDIEWRGRRNQGFQLKAHFTTLDTDTYSQQCRYIEDILENQCKLDLRVVIFGAEDGYDELIACVDDNFFRREQED